MNFYVVTPRQDKWDNFFSGREGDVQPHFFADLESCLERMRQTPPTLVILDLSMNEEELRTAASSLLMLNAFVHIAVVSAMDETAFHDSMEGLGILMQLPENLDPSCLTNLLDALKGLGC